MSEITLVPKEDIVFGTYESNFGLCIGIGGHEYGIFVAMGMSELRAHATDAMRQAEKNKCSEVEVLESNKPSKILKVVSSDNLQFCAKGIMARYSQNGETRYVLVLLTADDLKEHSEKTDRFYKKKSS